MWPPRLRSPQAILDSDTRERGGGCPAPLLLRSYHFGVALRDRPPWRDSRRQRCTNGPRGQANLSLLIVAGSVSA